MLCAVTGGGGGGISLPLHPKCPPTAALATCGMLPRCGIGTLGIAAIQVYGGGGATGGPFFCPTIGVAVGGGSFLSQTFGGGAFV